MTIASDRADRFHTSASIVPPPTTHLQRADCRGAGALRSDGRRALPGRVVLLANSATGDPPRSRPAILVPQVRRGHSTSEADLSACLSRITVVPAGALFIGLAAVVGGCSGGPILECPSARRWPSMPVARWGTGRRSGAGPGGRWRTLVLSSTGADSSSPGAQRHTEASPRSGDVCVWPGLRVKATR
jgi:hypothetical protein